MQNKSEFHGKWNIKQIFISVFLSFFLLTVSLIKREMSITKAIMFFLKFTKAGDLTYNSTRSLPTPLHLFPNPVPRIKKQQLVQRF